MAGFAVRLMCVPVVAVLWRLASDRAAIAVLAVAVVGAVILVLSFPVRDGVAPDPVAGVGPTPTASTSANGPGRQ